ncbi:hypothetical protein GA0115259_104224 [Streptomyces sp. MnatMP-M17]|nr:hypothetical protein GA0115259_104224 [Streptomyces sp. MnatMP-M17]
MTCRVCGRPLRSPESRTRGAGPVCWRNTTTPVRPAPAPPSHTAVPGQTELPLQPMQPTLWSL